MVDSAQLERYMATAKAAGVTQEQMKLYGRMGYVALPWTFAFHLAARECDKDDGPVMVALGGARGPGKSHAALTQACEDCLRYNGIKLLFLRKVLKAARESFDDLVSRVCKYIPHTYTPSTYTLAFDNGSKIRFGGYNNERDIEAYLGIEYNGAVIEECTQLSWDRINKIRGSIRTSRADWRPRLYLSSNPGGIGHGWFKEEFVRPYREKRQAATRFIPSTYRDNPYLDSGYIAYLEGLPGALGRAWRDGDWDSFEGQAFPEWNDTAHVREPFEVPEHWIRVRGVDWGSAAPFCCLWGAINPDSGRVIVYKELYETGLTDVEQARRIAAMTAPSEKIVFTFADPSMWASNTLDVVTSTADKYRENGVVLTKADNQRLAGKRRVDRAIADLPDGEPGLIVFSNCANLRRTLPELTRDELNPEDVNTHGEDHAYDALRYLLTNAKQPAMVSASNPNKARNQANPWLKRKGI